MDITYDLLLRLAPALADAPSWLVVAIVGGVGILFLWLVAPRLVPDRAPPMADTSPRIFSAQLNIPADSFAEGRALTELRKKTGNAMRVLRIQRGSSMLLPLPDIVIQAGDQLHLEDILERIEGHRQGRSFYNPVAELL